MVVVGTVGRAHSRRLVLGLLQPWEAQLLRLMMSGAEGEVGVRPFNFGDLGDYVPLSDVMMTPVPETLCRQSPQLKI